MNKKIFWAAFAAISVVALIYKYSKKKASSSDHSIPECCFDCEKCSMLNTDD